MEKKNYSCFDYEIWGKEKPQNNFLEATLIVLAGTLIVGFVVAVFIHVFWL